MSKHEVIMLVGSMVAQGFEYDVCLQQDASNPYDAEASECASKFFNMCEGGMNIHEAFVMAFFA